MRPSVSIVIPTYNGAIYLRETLPALKNQVYDGLVEILAIDSSSTDETVSLLEQFGARFEIIPQAEFGHGKTRNQAVRLSNSDFIVFLSQDALPVGQNWLETLIKSVEDPTVGAAYARQLPRPNATPLERFFHQTVYLAKSHSTQLHAGQPLTLDKMFFSNVCSVARREICLRFPFDETVIMSEDQFFSRDVLRAGFKMVYNAQAEVIHSHHYDLNTLFRRNFDSGCSMRGVDESPLSQRAAIGIHFINREVLYLLRKRQFSWLCYLPVYEAARITALLLGSRADTLPDSLRKKMSLHRNFWSLK